MGKGWSQFKETGKLPQDEKMRRLGLLVVDDESEIVVSLQEVFQKSFEIFHTSSAREALDLFRAHSPKIIITDQRMPGMSGIELLGKIKEINPDTVRILVTGYSDIEVVIKALNEGLAWKYVAKPWVHADLRKLVLDGAQRYLKEHGIDEKQYSFHSFLGF